LAEVKLRRKLASKEGSLQDRRCRAAVIAFTPLRAQRERGFVLLIVLWWLALLLFLGTQIAAATHTVVSISSNIRGRAVADATVEGAVHAAIFHILAGDWRADGAVHVVQGMQATAEVRIDNEGNKIDPNVAPAALMQALLQECGAAPKSAEELAAAIYDWRTLDIQRSGGTIQGRRYQAAGLNYRPPHSRFASLDELGLVLGMTQELYRCLEPHISVYALSVPSVSTTTDPVVRRALAVAYPNDPIQTEITPDQAAPVVRITADAEPIGGSRFRRIAVVRVVPAEPDVDFLYKILAWGSPGG
jgi:general secretion pathway protein K